MKIWVEATIKVRKSSDAFSPTVILHPSSAPSSISVLRKFRAWYNWAFTVWIVMPISRAIWASFWPLKYFRSMLLLFPYRLGGYGYDSGYATLMNTLCNGHTGYNFHKDVLNSWTPENQSEDFARWEYDLRYFASSSERWLTKADYLNLQNISLGYQIRKHLLGRVGIQELVVSAGVDNIFYLSHRKGFIPSRDFDGNVDFGYFPVTWEWKYRILPTLHIVRLVFDF